MNQARKVQVGNVSEQDTAGAYTLRSALKMQPNASTPSSDAPACVRAAHDPAAFRALAGQVVQQLAGHLETVYSRQGPVLKPQDPEELLATLAPIGQASAQPAEFERLIGEVIAHANHVHHPGFIGHQVSAPVPASVLVDMASSLLSNGMAVYEMGQLHTAMERRVIEWLARCVGFNGTSDGILTHGGSLGNLTALLAARQAKAGYDVWTEGQRAPMSVLVSNQAHYCIARAVQCMGWGQKGATTVETDNRFRLRPEFLEGALRRAEDEGRQVLAVVASSCSTAAGSFDPLHEIADFCAEHDLWLHADGAHGASLTLSDRYRAPVQGLERADSITWDLHKLMGLPALNTAVLFRDGKRSYEAFAQEASYLFDETDRDEWFQIGRRTMECTKRGLSVVAYTMLQSLGTNYFREHIEQLMDVAQHLAHELEASDEFELATFPDANILCFRHVPADGSVKADDLDAHQAHLRQAIVESGRAYITQAKLRGSLWLRATVQNPLTDRSDVQKLLTDLREFSTSLPR